MSTAPTRVHFPARGTFHADLKRGVADYFERTGRSQHGGLGMHLKTALMLAWLIGSYVALLCGDVSGWQAGALAISVGLAMAGVGFTVMHDANHGSYSRHAGVNRALACTLELIGGSSYLWRQKHNILHHTYTNIAGLDTDGDAGPLLRLCPSQPRRRFHRLQHFYAWVLYGLFALKWWCFDDFRELITGRIGGQAYPRARARDVALLLAGKAVFFGWAFALPVVLHPTWMLVPLWLLASATVGIVLAAVFQLAHCVGEADHFAVRGGEVMQAPWAEHQVMTTMDFARDNRVLGWYLGGLNFQVEHHLFPKVCHVHYRALSRIVERTSRAHGVRYRATPTLRAALVANVRWLAQLGRSAGPYRPCTESTIPSCPSQ